MKDLYRFEFNLATVKYLQRAVNNQTLKGVQQAQDLLKVLEMLSKPMNAEELEKAQLEELKEKYEPVTEKKSEVKDKK